MPPISRDQAPAASTTTSASSRPSAVSTPARPGAGNHDFLDRAVLVQLDPGAAAGGDQRAGEAAVLDLMVVAAQDRGGDAGLQMRLAAAAPRPR